MIEKLLFDKSLNFLERGLDATSMRNEVISNNLANVDTPGFKRSDVLFEEEFQKALSDTPKLEGVLTNARHIPIGGVSQDQITPRIVTDSTTSLRNDGNNVDIDREMAGLAKNSIEYEALVQEMNSELQKIKIAIEGR